MIYTFEKPSTLAHRMCTMCAIDAKNQCCGSGSGSGSGLFWSPGSGSGKIPDPDPDPISTKRPYVIQIFLL